MTEKAKFTQINLEMWPKAVWWKTFKHFNILVCFHKKHLLMWRLPQKEKRSENRVVDLQNAGKGNKIISVNRCLLTHVLENMTATLFKRLSSTSFQLSFINYRIKFIWLQCCGYGADSVDIQSTTDQSVWRLKTFLNENKNIFVMQSSFQVGWHKECLISVDSWPL